VLIQPLAAGDVATAVARTAIGVPLNGTVEVAGPELCRLEELIRRGLSARHDPRHVEADPHARPATPEALPMPNEPTPSRASQPQRSAAWQTALTPLQQAKPPFIPDGAEVMTVLIEFPPGDPGTPPHRHSGPAFGYVLEGEMLFELEGEPERAIRAGEAFWEPGGDVIHYQDGNNRTDTRLRFLVTMMGVPGRPMLELVDDEELAQRKDRRAPRPPS
jgi:quercetin dioxygenase-like cupin family protein